MKTLILKDCSVRSIWTYLNSQSLLCYKYKNKHDNTTNTQRERERERDRDRDRETERQRKKQHQIKPATTLNNRCCFPFTFTNSASPYRPRHIHTRFEHRQCSTLVLVLHTLAASIPPLHYHSSSSTTTVTATIKLKATIIHRPPWTMITLAGVSVQTQLRLRS